ncbi:MAG: response regulator [Hyphomicrobiales bacterium]|uniref:response regulator n=1 Tax=Rhabdaerophilum calidifontis TaxID=2604328 RepID=UPI001FE8139C|nr:response regulator [Rhabdaerophilum calidifontis]MCA1951776.1 response regulator [Hyphomicrobiales bacterium]MCA2000080.1 response regulator [Hyphomicrobiales bacterium]
MSISPRKAMPSDEAPHILVVDDDQRIRTLLHRFLTENGYRVTTAENAREARGRLEGLVFDLLVLDVMMPGENGLDLARALRAHSPVPILMLTARAEIDDRIAGLQTGADDYMTKPFDPRELLLRISSILRRAALPPQRSEQAPESIRFGPFHFHLARGELRREEEHVRITEREREMLRALAGALGETLPREALAENGTAANERTIDVQINRLRRKIEADPSNPLYLQTVRGIGYRLVIDR